MNHTRRKLGVSVIAVLAFLFSSPVAFADSVIVSATPSFTGNGSYWTWNDNDSVKMIHGGIFWEWPTAYRMETITFHACVSGGANPSGYFGVYIGDADTGNIGSRSSMPLVTFANPIVSIASTTQCTNGWTDYILELETPQEINKGEMVALIPCDATSSQYSCYDNSVYPSDITTLRFEGGVNNYMNRFYGFCYGFSCGPGTVYEFSTSTYTFQPAFVIGGSWIPQTIENPMNLETCLFSSLDLGDCFSSLGIFFFIPSTQSLEQFGTLFDGIRNKPPFGYFTSAVESLNTINGSSTGSVTIMQSQPIMQAVFTPLRSLLLAIIGFFALVWLYKRLTNIHI